MKSIILFGGSSDERQVSVATAQNVARLLDAPLCWFWAPGGAIHEVTIDELIAHQHAFENDFIAPRGAIHPRLESALDAVRDDDAVFFLALHGGAGEDGTVQRMMEERGIAFTGSGSEASAAAFDKGRAKEIVAGKVRTAESRAVTDVAQIAGVAREMLGRHGKIVLKPIAGGSSRGLFFVDRSTNFDEVMGKVTALRIPYIVEQFIAGRELTVGIADVGEGPFALPVLEIEVDPGFAFDYEGKYLGKGTREICPAKIPDTMREEAQRTALAAHQALGCDGYSRSDLIAAQDGVWFLELNTLPGLTTSSLVPQELREAGIGMREFLEKQMALARKRLMPTPSS